MLAILDTLPDALFELDLDGRYLDYHSPRADLLAVPPETLLGKTVHEVMPAIPADACMAALQEANTLGFSTGRLIELRLPAGHRWFELSISRKSNGAGRSVSFIVLARNVTQRVASEHKLQRLTDLYAALSQCNQAILRCTSAAELFPIICADAVNYGGMKMAWIGTLNAATGLIVPVASSGEGTAYLQDILITPHANQPSGQGPVGTAFREARPVWFQDFLHDPRAQAWRARASEFGWASVAGLPLTCHGAMYGVLSVYSGTVNAFDDSAQALLLEIAQDISFALTRFADERERNRVQMALQDSEERYRRVFHTSPDSVNINRLSDGLYIDVNEGFERLSGWTADEVIGKTSQEINIWRCPADRHRLKRALNRDGHCYNMEVEFCRKDGTVATALMSAALVRFDNVDCILSMTRDMSDIRLAQERINQLAHFDQLTGLPNRSQLQERFEFVRQLAQRNGESLALMFLDLDHFKNVNDTLGHTIGDRLLVQVSQRLAGVLSAGDTLSRMGGDEFILLLPSATEESASQMALKVLSVMAEPFIIDDHELVSTLSIGIALYPHDGDDFETLSKNADIAMYRIKRSSHNNFCFFTPEMQSHSARRLQLSNALYFGLTRGEFLLHYQPQISLQDGHMVGVEALIRWQHPEFGAVAPSEFIPIAEDSGQILAIGEWVLRTAVTQMKAWLDAGMKPMVMSVNLSTVQFRHPDLLALVMQTLQMAGLPAQYLELELTEAMAMDNPTAAIALMNQLHEQGVRLSIDDFGTGYSSLSYLKKFKVSKLKIDQSFVRDIGDDKDDRAIVTAVINLASSLGMQTIAEGVETPGQLAFLRLQGCDEAQGYYFSKPLPVDQLEAFAKTMTAVP
ncbi:sensor domain-containing protein [Rhodoferax antarcticus]|uniref:sensor domain-containing protein n=1 Tax=Rhodoferax antarcticus TaxID=81479 RepID=UPI0022253DC4|nr:EAL domain-containing protein [Rhodoferax antarcticus]MCW2311700.1 diguanylate cyclase (GGDEF)-like protein/PAS domain S-box-containing protein [Rhodoferax antarcticus]